MMKLHIQDQVYEVEYTEKPIDISNHLNSITIPFFTYDTESTGLHIKKDRPFLGAVCMGNKVFVFPTTKNMLTCLPLWASKVRRVFAHNTTYDMHMTANIMGDKFPLQIKNWGDSQGLARLSFEAISTRDGGHKLSLKYIGKKFIDKDADYWEKEAKNWLDEETKARRKVLLAMLKPFRVKAKEMDVVLKQRELGVRFGDESVQEVYEAWQEDYPPVTYQDVPMEIMLPYVATDVILTKHLVLMAMKVVVQKQQVDVMNREFRLLSTIYRMERRGLEVDIPYLDESARKMKTYIEKMYKELRQLTGIDDLKVGQHAKIREMYENWLGETLKSSDKQFLNRMTSEYKDSKQGRVGWLISTLRRCEKWLETYIVRIKKVAEYDGRFYTQLNQFSPVSGRFSGDAQQFPKDKIQAKEHEDDKDAPEIYHPRKAFKGTMYYLDYSQVELRMQGHYTLRFGGDTNLCRAYMPFRCRHYKTGEEYRFDTLEQRTRWIELREGHPTDKHWEDQLKEGWSVWINPDTDQTWVPTDVHSQTSLKALVIMGLDPSSMSKDELKWWRNIGKRFNFMRNYGGGDKKAAETLEIALEAAKAMNRGYSEAFPLVITYQNWIDKVMWNQGYFENEYGRRYYLTEHWRFYKCGNYAIQGSCADMLKIKMIAIDNYLEEHTLWDILPMILCVHDELQFENISCDPSLEKHIWAIKEMMEDTPEILLPIVAEVEKTSTNWAEKKALHAA